MSTTNTGILGCIIAGGRSRRFGQDKGLYVYRGRTMIEHVYAAMKPVLTETFIVADDAEKYSFLGIGGVPDIIPGKGPIGGIYTGLVHAGTSIFTAACDMPFLDSGLIAYMLQVREDHDVVVPFIGGNYEPLHAIYAPSCTGHLKRLIERDDRRIIHFFGEVSVRKITEDEIRGFCNPEKAFMNINYFEDLDAHP